MEFFKILKIVLENIFDRLDGKRFEVLLVFIFIGFDKITHLAHLFFERFIKYFD
jgi:hypothetical protein